MAAGNRTKVLFAAQDLTRTAGGASTGEVTAGLLRELGVAYAIIGHSERRALGETDEIVAEKTRNALQSKIVPIICVGERDRDEDGKYLAFLRSQIHAVFSILSPKERLQVVIAYEPIWAIGKPANQAITPNDLTEMMLYIRKILSSYIPGTASKKVRVLYGGSVEANNAKDLISGSGIDGLLVGRASVDSDTFSALVKAARSA